MKPRLLACLAFVAVAAGLTASTDEEKVLQLSYDLDTATAEQNLAALAALLNEHYVYTEPDAAKRPADEALASRAAYRLSRDQGWSDEAPSVRVTGDTAIVTGMYRVLDASGTLQASPTGWFTTTWVKSGGTWTLLAEHRSRNLTTTVTSPPPASPTSLRPPPKVVAKTKPAEAPAVATTAATSPATAAGTAAPATSLATRKESQVSHGALPVAATNLFRAYEPNSVGYTYDEDDDPFLDFTFSAMFPLLPNQPYPPRRRDLVPAELPRKIRYAKPDLYFAATMRAGQYIGTRPSSPVVGKRFNPLLSVRFWALTTDGKPRSEDDFLEFYYAHESNGQFIASEERFRQQLLVYLDQEEDATDPADPAVAAKRAYRSARDNISRGWDYVGVQFAHDWNTTVSETSPFWWLQGRSVTMGMRAKFNYFLKTGLLQGDAEEYNDWEKDPEGKPRKEVDGISLRYTFVIAPPVPKPGAPVEDDSKWKHPFRFERRYAFTWTTGYDQPFRYNTFKAEGSILIFDTLPLTLWGRYGYNSDLVDYYRKNYSVGISLTFWDY